jgi:hypothetical protein
MTSALVTLAVGFGFLVTVFLLVVAIAEGVKRLSDPQIDFLLITFATLAISYVSGKVILVVLRTEGLI